MADVAPMPLQQSFWNSWNATHNEAALRDVSIRQAEIVCGWLDGIGRRDLDIVEVGCGTGWLCPRLAQYGRVTGTDLSDQVLARAQRRAPHVTYVAGDFMSLDLGAEAFDVLVTLEVLSHVADQPAFVRKLAGHLRPGGLLMMATQNRFVLERFNDVPPPSPGQLRRWVDRRELRALLDPEFVVREVFSVTPKANRGVMRLVNSSRVNRPVRALLGDRVERLKERMGLGWTLMALAERRR
ncbi:class I SAM-dependent methyltransferase [Arenibaculum pallidiluteum]|uniref:class I SAM-dependent methyltransferase n=1 Tax=Arenibaculum pallidiluteum TaxID=2812559 RepID=UPI001A95B0B4|nr:class I SAM-dependent methyltransferase [Arenibaculum pallidiluteum]